MSYEFIASMNFGSKIDITDPCFKRDAWCRLNDIQIESGTYKCYAEYNNNYGQKVAAIAIAKNKSLISEAKEEIGFICVESGIAGFFDEPIEFDDNEWFQFCYLLNITHREKIVFSSRDYASFMCHGFFSISGFGDGTYSVFAHKNADGVPDALVILFI